MVQNLELEQLVKNTIARIFRVNVSLINEDTSAETIDAWDSLGHMRLVLSLEEEFGIMFDEHQIVKMVTVPQIFSVIMDSLQTKQQLQLQERDI
jgi:acyl carrier protein